MGDKAFDYLETQFAEKLSSQDPVSLEKLRLLWLSDRRNHQDVNVKIPVKPERVKPELGLSVSDFGFNQVLVPSNEVLCDMLTDSGGGTYTVE